MTDPGTILLAQLQNEEWGRKLLAIVGANPVKTTEIVLNFDDLDAHGDHNVWTFFDAGWIVGVSVMVTTVFDAGTTNELSFAATDDINSVNPARTPFATVAALSGGTGLGEQVNGLPASGTDVSFTPVRFATRFRVGAGYAATGTAATAGRAQILFHHVGLLTT